MDTEQQYLLINKISILKVIFVFVLVLFNDSWSQYGHLVSYKTILFEFLNLQIIISNIRPHTKWVVSLVIAYGHFNLPHGFVCVSVNILTLSPPRE